MKRIAIIPARSGSKGLKDKNIKLLYGKPLLAYTIQAAINADIFDTIIVSTDSKEYASIAKKWGAEVPFLRSPELSNDNASSWDVIKDVINMYRENGEVFDIITLLQPTSPLRTVEDIKEAYNLFINRDANTVVSVCQTDHSPLLTNTLPMSLSMGDFVKPELLNLPRQKLPKYYRINGAIYIIKHDFLINSSNLYKEKSYASIMNKENSVDIDDETDFKYAEFLLKSQYEQK